MKIYQIEISAGDRYAETTWIWRVFASKRGAYKVIFSRLKETEKGEKCSHYKDSGGNLVWVIGSEDGYTYTTYKINEMEIEE